jgi:hypothetical protein
MQEITYKLIVFIHKKSETIVGYITVHFAGFQYSTKETEAFLNSSYIREKWEYNNVLATM